MDTVIINSKYLDNLVIGSLNAKWSARGDRILRYYVDIRHNKLNLHKEVSAPEIFILQSKIDALMAGWDIKYEKFIERNNILSGQSVAVELTDEAVNKIDSLSRILEHTLAVDDRVDWDSLKDKSSYKLPKDFPVAKPSSVPLKKPVYIEPKIGLLDKIFRKKTMILEEASQKHEISVEAWQLAESNRKIKLATAISDWEQKKNAFWEVHLEKKKEFEKEQRASHTEVDRIKHAVENGEQEAVVEHASLVLESSNYYDLFEKSYAVQYEPETKLLKLAYDLPAMDILPKTKIIRFMKSTGELKETEISLREQKNNFESVSYQLCLRTIHELFESDVSKNFDNILFNGFVNFIDPATGQEARSCLLSILVDRETFLQIDLARVDPKVCFKSLKGISASSLSSITPIPPVMEMTKEDRRFIESRDVDSAMNSETNLASISWEDFEHLVRELFDKEFAARGGEVKVTQSSSDGGVDAIAFDPDPITGGKIVIQAKRYTRTVGVSAIRDLYGTVMNEGASRGIIVTTADYGPDAYKFASDKPITLMNGANLLHMLEKHGYKAKIDIQKARAQMNAEQR